VTEARILVALLLVAFAAALSSCTPHAYDGVNRRGPFVDLAPVSIDTELPLGGRIL
jgi:hypothetical protein